MDTIVAAMESGNRSLVNRKALYVAISRARYRAELIADDGRKLSDRLERASGERVSALDAAAGRAVPHSGYCRHRHRPESGWRLRPAIAARGIVTFRRSPW